MPPHGRSWRPGHLDLTLSTLGGGYPMKLNKPSGPALFATGIILILAIALSGTLLYIKNQPAPARGVSQLMEIAQMEADSSKWGINFPNQYSTLLMTGKNETRTTYGGSVPY